MDNLPTKCLILDGYTRNALAIIRSLGRKGMTCDAVCYDTGNQKLDNFNRRYASKYISNVMLVQGDEPLLGQLVRILTATRYAFLFAAGTKASNFIAQNKPALSKYTCVVSEDYEKIAAVHDKASAMQLAEALGIPHPGTYIARSIHELKDIAEKLNGSAIVKLPDSFASAGLSRYGGSPGAFISDYVNRYGFDYEEGAYPLIQQLLHGSLFDTTAFAVNGRAHAILSQKRVVTAWLRGGGGAVNRTTGTPDIIQYTKAILDHLKWNGHIELDWIYNRADKRYYLLELNPKYWGTTQLTISAGYDFPLWSTLLYSRQNLPPAGEYKKGLTYRWLDEELHAIFAHSATSRQLLFELVKFAGRFLVPGTRLSLDLRDPKPFVGKCIETFHFIYRSILKGRPA